AYTKIQDQLNNSKPVPVPNVIDLNVQLAKNKLIAHGFVPKEKLSFDDTVPKGVVFDQSPIAGSKLGKNSPVQITVSNGPPQVPVPNVIGKTRDDAVATLTNAGLTYAVVSVHSDKPPDTVTGQFPHPGTKVKKGSKVQINVSTGPQPVSVPNVVGQSFDQASATLQNAGFGVKRMNVDSNQPADTVVSQSPSGSAAPGATITLSVSKGPKQSTVPDVTSEDEASAKSDLQAAGFRVIVQTQSVTDPGLNGIVLSQSPHGGTKAPHGSTVTITVGQVQSSPPPPPTP
ncbi:MAG: PASTA domain-containing protein, partial [Gaiellaceae bacterium]